MALYRKPEIVATNLLVFSVCLLSLIPSGESIQCYNCTWTSKPGDDPYHSCNCNMPNSLRKTTACFNNIKRMEARRSAADGAGMRFPFPGQGRLGMPFPGMAQPEIPQPGRGNIMERSGLIEESTEGSGMESATTGPQSGDSEQEHLMGGLLETLKMGSPGMVDAGMGAPGVEFGVQETDFAETNPEYGLGEAEYCLEYYTYNNKYSNNVSQAIIRTGYNMGGKTFRIPGSIPKFDGASNETHQCTVISTQPEYQAVCICKEDFCNNELHAYLDASIGSSSRVLIATLVFSPWLMNILNLL